MNKKTTDLKTYNEITAEHCYILLQRVGQAISQMEADSGYDGLALANEIDPVHMKDHFESHISKKAFQHLFKSEFGKNILVGMFVQKLVQESLSEEVDESDEV